MPDFGPDFLKHMAMVFASCKAMLAIGQTVEIAMHQEAPRHGPRAGAIRRYDERDRALFDELERLTASGEQTVWAVCLMLARDGQVAGTGSPESRAKRLQAIYSRERKEKAAS